MKITHKGSKNIGRLACCAVGVVFLCGCNWFGFYQPQQASLPTTTRELTLSESSPDSNADPKYDAVKAKSKDGQLIKMDITLLFKIDPLMGNHILKKWGEVYETDFILPTLRHTTEQVISAYTARDLYGNGRVDFAQALQTEINKDISAEGFIFGQLLIRNIVFDPVFTSTVESEYVSAQATALHQQETTPTP